MGTGLDAAVQAVADPKNKRHGPLHVAAGTKYLEMCKMLVKKYNCNPNAAGADGTLHSVFCSDFCLGLLFFWVGIGSRLRSVV